jgi:hypothetical protein
MDEVKKKRQTYNKIIIDRLIKKYGLGKRYITMCLSGDVKSEMADVLTKDHSAMTTAVEKLLETM